MSLQAKRKQTRTSRGVWIFEAVSRREPLSFEKDIEQYLNGLLNYIKI